MKSKESSRAPSLQKLMVKSASELRKYMKEKLNTQITVKKPINYSRKANENPQELTLNGKNSSENQTDQDPQEISEVDIEMVPEENDHFFARWSDSMLRYRKLEHVRINRGRIFDWFVDICYIFEQSWRTLWAAMSILDKMIIEKGKITTQNIHIYGMTSFFIASKYHETQNISLYTLIKRIGHNRYTKEQILKCEEQIFTWICIVRNDSSFHFPTIQDRVFECFPELPEIRAKKIMMEMFYCMQEPHMLVEERKEDFTEKELTRKVGESVLSGQRFRGCEMIEAYFNNEYKCSNIRLRGLQLKL